MKICLKSLVPIFILLFVSSAIGQENEATEIDTITVTKVKELIDAKKDIALIDVRTLVELESKLGHIEGIIHIPSKELRERYKEILAIEADQIIMICRSGNRSRRATEFLTGKVKNVKNMVGGMRAWNREGYPIKTTWEKDEKKSE